MTREEIKEMLPVLQAFADGKTIESRCIKGDKSLWYDDEDPSFDNDLEYRIKSEPKYRPFKNAEECLQEIQKHQPIGWVKSKEATKDIYFTITGLTNVIHGVILNSTGGWGFSGLFNYYTFADGTPFGVKEEE